MQEKQSSYDRTYSGAENVFGDNPESCLVEFHEKIDKTLAVLDIGAGQGRNALYLAKKGFRVHALEPSAVASAFLSKQKKKTASKMQVIEKGFLDLDVTAGSYSAILVFGLIQILNLKDRLLLLNKLNQWLKPEGHVFITGFACEDPSFSRYKNSWTETSKNLFTGPEGNVRFFLEPDEVLNVFKDYKVLYHWEGMGEWHHHGDSKLERHAMVEAVFKKIQ